VAAHQQVELLVGAAQLDVALQGHRVVALHQRVEELVHADRLAGLEALGKVVALHHARHGVPGGQLDHAARAQGVRPFAVVAQLGLAGVQHLEGLLAVGFGVHADLLGRERRARAVAPGRVADQAGEVADQKDHLMPQVLQLAHLVQHHGVTQVDVGRRRVQPQLDAQRLAGGFGAGQLLQPVLLRQQFVASAQRNGHGGAHTLGDGGVCKFVVRHRTVRL